MHKLNKRIRDSKKISAVLTDIFNDETDKTVFVVLIAQKNESTEIFKNYFDDVEPVCETDKCQFAFKVSPEIRQRIKVELNNHGINVGMYFSD